MRFIKFYILGHVPISCTLEGSWFSDHVFIGIIGGMHLIIWDCCKLYSILSKTFNDWGHVSKSNLVMMFGESQRSALESV